MKVLLTVAVAAGLVWIGLATPNGIAGRGCPLRPVSRHQALLTIRALHIYREPIGTRVADLAKGPIWDLAYAARPGEGATMVIDAHDVTPVPCYGAHGPFYHLNRIKPGERVKIRWNGKWRTYRFVMYPHPRPQSHPRVKYFPGEVVWFRCCWPRYTRKDYLYERAVLVKPKR
jgi:hypothetical protein